MTFSVLVRGYGETEPPQWLAISGLLSMMSRKYEVQPSTGDVPWAKGRQASTFNLSSQSSKCQYRRPFRNSR